MMTEIRIEVLTSSQTPFFFTIVCLRPGFTLSTFLVPGVYSLSFVRRLVSYYSVWCNNCVWYIMTLITGC